LKQVSGVTLSLDEAPRDAFYVGITVDRTERQPCVRTAATTDVSQFRKRAKRFPYDWRSLIDTLAKMYKDKEAVTLSGSVSIGEDGNLKLHRPSLIFQFDDAAYRSVKRQEDIHSLRQRENEQSEEVDAEKDGIVFVKLQDPEANIGTLVNGAGLAMNTVDALRLHGGLATNFLDTGGKATSETVKKSFELILKDPRVKVIFVNIFGGLTDGGMIAEGILLAFKEVDMKGVPVVVRIRGTNEEKGQKIIAESGLGLDAFDGFAETAQRVVELAESGRSG